MPSRLSGACFLFRLHIPVENCTAIPAAFRYWRAVSLRMWVTCWIAAVTIPARPRAETCCFFSSFKTLAMPRRL